MILETIKSSKDFEQIHQALIKPGQIIHGLTNSAKSFILSNLLEKSDIPVIFITQTHHDSQIYYREIKNLSSKDVYSFPCQEISPYDQVNSDITVLGQQFEVFDYWKQSAKQGSLTVVPFKSLSQLYIDKELLENNTIKLDKSIELAPEDLAMQLAKLGYQAESMVDSRGQFSHRGDILDVYPVCGEPIRIEFFGDNIESIRSFSLNSQKSIKELDSIKIEPRFLIKRDKEDGLADKLEELFKKQVASLKGEAKESFQSLYESEIANAQEELYWEGVEYYRSLLGQGSSSIFDYLPERCHIVFDEWEDLSYRLEDWEQQSSKRHEESVKQGKILPLGDLLHLPIDSVRENIAKYSQKLYLQTFMEMKQGRGVDESMSFEVLSNPAERYASKVDVFVDAIKGHLHKKRRVIIFSEQPQRVLGILKEWDIPAVYVDEKIAQQEELQSKNSIYQSLVWVQRDGVEEGFKLPSLNLVVLTDRELFGRSRQAIARQKIKSKEFDSKNVFTDISQLKIDDYIVHYKHGIGKYKGAEFVELDGQKREYLAVEYADEARLLIPVDQVNLLSRFRTTGDMKPRLSKLGGQEWEKTKKKVRKSVQKIAHELLNLYAMRAKQKGHEYPPDTPWQVEMEDAFPYSETDDQLKAIANLKEDMESPKLLDRLICGDAGFGKTEVVLRAVFKAVMEGNQVAILVPTTVLAQQHFNVFKDRFAPYPVKVGLLSRFKTAKEQRELVKRLKIGECDVVIGTHRLLQKDIQFKSLGLLVIDEEQRFGVASKEKLKQLRGDLDVITMSATPIPRTLHMALSGAMDISLIGTPPVNRLPVKTYVGEYKTSVVRTAILHELERGGQVFFVHNRVETIEEIANEIQMMVPEATIRVAHGQMQGRELEEIMFSFVQEEFQVLVCTTIIETGLDIANANTIIIDNSNTMGLSQLYQLRGRVGRSDTQAYAYCLYRPGKEISDTARSRLKSIRELTRLGSGYQIALRDMEIRGVGNILGAEQHGHMLSVGFDLYCKLLNDTVEELQGNKTPIDIDKDISVDLNVTAYFPDFWIKEESQRINEYKRLSDVQDEKELDSLINEWIDRFGKLPNETNNLIDIVRLKMLARSAKIHSIATESNGVKMVIDGMRLQQWIPIQRSLSDFLQPRAIYKPGALGSRNSQPYILIKADGMDPETQIESLRELVRALIKAKA